MKLREALQLLNARSSGGAAPYAVHLVTGFEPLHLKTFLAAHLSQCLAAQGDPRTVDVRTGLYGDFGGNWSRAIEEAGTVPVAAVLEWADLHPAMGWREAALSASWDQGEALSEIESRLRAWLILLREAGPGRRFLALPALPLPPWVQRGLDGQSSSFELELRVWWRNLPATPPVPARVSRQVAQPPPGMPARQLSTGFPFTLEFASELAERLARLILPATPKKGIVTDLDRTLWRGVVGDDGPSAVSWDLDRQARVHGWWQQFLASMGKQGVLIGVASKNDREPVEQALARHDLLVPTDSIFPLEVNWGDKAASIRRIAAAWNIGLDSIVFVDDNQLEPWRRFARRCRKSSVFSFRRTIRPRLPPPSSGSAICSARNRYPRTIYCALPPSASAPRSPRLVTSRRPAAGPRNATRLWVRASASIAAALRRPGSWNSSTRPTSSTSTAGAGRKAAGSPGAVARKLAWRWSDMRTGSDLWATSPPWRPSAPARSCMSEAGS